MNASRLARPVVWAAARGCPIVVLLALVVGSTLFRFWQAQHVPAPWITPDEQTYGLIGRSLYESGRFEILGHDTGLLSFVYPALIGLPLHLLGPSEGYATAKALQALVMSLTAIPVYVWGRSLSLRRTWALAAAALTLAVPGLAYSGFLMTEVAFYPIVCISAWAMARALAEPNLENQAFLLAAILLAVTTRLQAIVLVPVLMLALLLKLGFERGRIASLRAFLPVFGGLLACAGVWALLTRNRVGGLLGSYRITGSTSYHPLAAVRFGLYHLADVLLMTAVVPMIALTVLVARAAAAREPSLKVRAFAAVAAAYVLGFVAEVGLFSSSLLGRLGERYLFGLSPLLFLALALWLERAAPRPVLPTALASFAALGLLALLPIGFVSEAAAPDAFSVIPLYEIRQHVGASALKLGLLAAALLLLTLFAVAPRRPWLPPATVFVLLVAASLSASHFVAKQAAGFRMFTVGSDPRWIDRFATGPVSFVYAGEYGFSKGGPVWANLFWNHKITDVLSLRGARVVGPVSVRQATIAPDGRLLAGGRPVQAESAVASTAISFFGETLNRGASYVLWQLARPVRVSSFITGMRLLSRDIDVRARMNVYACGDGALELMLVAPEARRITIFRDGDRYRTIMLNPGAPWTGSISAPTTRRRGVCTFELVTEGGGVHADRFQFVRRNGSTEAAGR